MLLGTCPFQRNKGYSLQAQACFLSPEMSLVFLTFSVANIQQQNLYHHFPSQADIALAEDHVRHSFTQDGIQNNLHIIAKYLVIRLQIFTEHVLCLYLKFTDYQEQLEQQAYGTGYYHALFWIPTAPALNQKTEGSQAEFARFWGMLIIAWNLDQLQVPNAQNPTSLALGDVVNIADQFVVFLNCLQIHSAYCVLYCLQQKKDSNTPLEYCFFFP